MLPRVNGIHYFVQDARNFYCRVCNNQNHRQELVSSFPVQRKLNKVTEEGVRYMDSKVVHYRVKCRNGSVLKFSFDQFRSKFLGLRKPWYKYKTLRDMISEHEKAFGGNPPSGSLGVYGNALRRLKRRMKRG